MMEFLTLGTKHQLSQLENGYLQIGDEDIPPDSNARNIGVLVVDATMEMNGHVIQITSSLYALVANVNYTKNSSIYTVLTCRQFRPYMHHVFMVHGLFTKYQYNAAISVKAITQMHTSYDKLGIRITF